MALEHITAEQIAAMGVVAAPDTLTGSPAENKAIFDRLVRDLVAGVVNQVIDETNGILEAEVSIEEQENERVAAENGRITAESGRVEAENGRQTAETGRTNAESGRVTAENGRVTAENGRQTAETGRANAESGRVTAEAARVTAEQGRVSETSGVVVQATEQANLARHYAETAQEIAGGNFAVSVNGVLPDEAGNVQLPPGEQLLVNAKFAAPYLVNQRGQSVYTGPTYGPDQWKAESGVTATLENDYITLTTTNIYNAFVQTIENGYKRGGNTVTLTALVKGNYRISIIETVGGTTPTVLAQDIGDVSDWTYASCTITLPAMSSSDLLKVYIRCNNTSSYASFKAVKLEPGSISTLSYDTPPTPAEQELNLQTCMRYYLPLGNGLFAVKKPGYNFGALVHPPVKMRTTPTVLYGTLTSFSPAASGQTCTFLGVAVLGGGTELLLQVSQPIGDNEYAVGHIDGFTGLSAEL